MQILILDADSGSINNEAGSGSELSIAELDGTLLRAVPVEGASEQSVRITVGATAFDLSETPYEIRIGSSGSDDLTLQPGDFVITAEAFSGTDSTGDVVDNRTIAVTAFEGLDADGMIIPSEFDQTSESEVETESETEVEAEAAPGAAGAAVATGATAAAAGSNALT